MEIAGLHDLPVILSLTMPSGHITDWNPDRGFGFVESDGHRIFLHQRDFAKRHKIPEVGDHLQFELGKDKQDRPCAKKAVHVNDGGRFTSEAIFLLAFLLGAPICALVKLSSVISPAYLAVYALAISTSTYFTYAWDKNRARKKGQREPEQVLHLLEFLGGWPGAFIAQRHLRHKCSKVNYQIVFWLIIAVHQSVAVDYLRNWSVALRVMHAFKQFLS